jgi:hypothetical protein
MSDLQDNEFPPQAIGWSEDEDAEEGRRNFLKLMGASLALAGLTACTRQPTEHIMPYVRQPEDLIPGKPLYYATAATLGGVANGVLMESHEGRPTKIEGNSTIRTARRRSRWKAKSTRGAHWRTLCAMRSARRRASMARACASSPRR